MNLADLLTRSVQRFADRTAVVFGNTRLSYAQLDGAAGKVATLLRDSGVQPGDRVAVSIPNLPWFPVVYFGILKAGATVVPLNVLLKSREIAYHLADSDALAYFAFEGTPELPIGAMGREAFENTDSCSLLFEIPADPAAAMPWTASAATTETIDRDDDDTAVLLYTSGTTGQAKGAELRHRNMRDNALIGQQVFEVDPDRPDIYLGVLPLFHSFGQSVVMNGAIAFGGSMVLMARFDAKQALRVMLNERVTFFAGVPTMYWALLGALDDDIDVDTLARNLRVSVCGGAPLATEIHHRFADRFGVTILEGYGLSETSPVAAFSLFGKPPRVGSIGVPVPGVQMKLIDADWTEIDGADVIGEIAIKGHNVMKGYFRRPEATDQAIRNGWFRTGDLARRDLDGNYYIVDRSKDLIIRGGFNVYPREVEELLLTHPAVSLAAVIGVPDEENGEEIKAFVIKNAGDPTTEQELVAWASNELASFKYPRAIEFVAALPMTATGKILKRQLPRG